MATAPWPIDSARVCRHHLRLERLPLTHARQAARFRGQGGWAGTAAPVDDSSPFEPARLAQLFAGSGAFFARDHNLDRAPEHLLAIWLVGMGMALDRLDLRLAEKSTSTGSI